MRARIALHAAAPGSGVGIVALDETQRSRFTPPSVGCDSVWAVELGA